MKVVLSHIPYKHDQTANSTYTCNIKFGDMINQFISDCHDEDGIERLVEMDGIEKLADGSTKAVKFSIQVIPKNRYNEAISHMINNFLVDEVLCKSMKLSEDQDAIEDFRKLWYFILMQNISVGTFKIDSNNIISELVAVNILSPFSSDVEKDFENCVEKFQSKNAKKLLMFMHNMSNIVNIYETYGVEKYISGIGLSVASAFRGQKLGVHLLQARNAIGKKYGITATSTVFTNPFSQISAEKAGFTTVFKQDYSEFLDDDGEPLFPNLNTKEVKIMAKRLE